MFITELEETIKSFAIPHRDGLLPRRFSTLVTGGAGIGKTDVIKKVGTDLDMAVVITHVAQLEPADLIGIPRSVEIRPNVRIQRYDLPGYLPHYKVNEDGSIVTQVFEDGIERKMIDVDLLGSKVRNKKALIKKHGDNWRNKVKGVMIFLDEINRAAGDDTKQAIFELPGDYALHDYEVPDGCVIFAAGNPPTDDYQINEMDQEKAWMDRFIHLTAHGRVEDSISYFQKNNFENSIISFISADNEALMEKEDSFELNIQRTPRSYEILDLLLKHVKLPDSDSVRREVYTGILGYEYGNNFANHLKESLEYVPTGLSIIKDYPSIRQTITEAVLENKSSLYNQSVRYLYVFLKEEENVKNHLLRKATKDDVERILKRDEDLLSDFPQLNTLTTPDDDINSVKIGDEIPNPDYVLNLITFLQDLPSDVRMGFLKLVIDYPWVNDILGREQSLFDFLHMDGETVQNDEWTNSKE